MEIVGTKLPCPCRPNASDGMKELDVKHQGMRHTEYLDISFGHHVRVRNHLSRVALFFSLVTFHLYPCLPSMVHRSLVRVYPQLARTIDGEGRNSVEREPRPPWWFVVSL